MAGDGELTIRHGDSFINSWNRDRGLVRSVLALVRLTRPDSPHSDQSAAPVKPVHFLPPARCAGRTCSPVAL
jgi:hypothetical protein